MCLKFEAKLQRDLNKLITQLCNASLISQLQIVRIRLVLTSRARLPPKKILASAGGSAQPGWKSVGNRVAHPCPRLEPVWGTNCPPAGLTRSQNGGVSYTIIASIDSRVQSLQITAVPSSGRSGGTGTILGIHTYCFGFILASLLKQVLTPGTTRCEPIVRRNDKK